MVYLAGDAAGSQGHLGSEGLVGGGQNAGEKLSKSAEGLAA